jgi:hypothetical protein
MLDQAKEMHMLLALNPRMSSIAGRFVWNCCLKKLFFLSSDNVEHSLPDNSWWIAADQIVVKTGYSFVTDIELPHLNLLQKGSRDYWLVCVQPDEEKKNELLILFNFDPNC